VEGSSRDPLSFGKQGGGSPAAALAAWADATDAYTQAVTVVALLADMQMPITVRMALTIVATVAAVTMVAAVERRIHTTGDSADNVTDNAGGADGVDGVRPCGGSCEADAG